MLWPIFGIFTAIFFALVHIMSKYAAGKAEPYYLSNAIWVVYSILSLPLVIFFHKKIVLNVEAFLGLILVGLISFSTNIIYLKSLRDGDISKTVPLLSITPVFTLLIAMLWLREFPKPAGMAGIMLIIAGAYFLNFEHFRRDRILEPLRQVFKNRASRLMLIVAAAFGIGSVADKFVVNHSNAFTRVVLFGYFTVFFNTAYLAIRDRKRFIVNTKGSFRIWRMLLLIDVFYLLTLFFQMYGLSLTFTAYIISLKRTSAIFSVILAYFLFGERRYFKTVLPATILMVLGVVLIVLL